jgi:hypothetical protein
VELGDRGGLERKEMAFALLPLASGKGEQCEKSKNQMAVEFCRKFRERLREKQKTLNKGKREDAIIERRIKTRDRERTAHFPVCFRVLGENQEKNRRERSHRRSKEENVHCERFLRVVRSSSRECCVKRASIENSERENGPIGFSAALLFIQLEWPSHCSIRSFLD